MYCGNSADQRQYDATILMGADQHYIITAGMFPLVYGIRCKND